MEDALEQFRDIANERAVAISLHNLGSAATHVGYIGRALAAFEEGLDVAVQIGFKDGIANCLDGIAAIAALAGEPHAAARHLAAGEALRETTGSSLEPFERKLHTATATAVRRALTEESRSAAWSEGRTMPLDDAIADARESVGRLVEPARGPPSP